jgi:hypothetical protein
MDRIPVTPRRKIRRFALSVPITAKGEQMAWLDWVVIASIALLAAAIIGARGQ